MKVEGPPARQTCPHLDAQMFRFFVGWSHQNRRRRPFARNNLQAVKPSNQRKKNKAGYTATPVACGWAGAIFEVTKAFGQKQYGHRVKKIKK